MNRIFPALLIGLLLTLPPLSAARANDSAYGGNGTHPMPLVTRDVRMAAEHVVLTFNRARRAWEVTCDFTFENVTDEAVKLTIGFPFPVYNEGRGDVATPDSDPMLQSGQPLVWGFRTLVDGKPVEVRQTRTLNNPAHPEASYEFAYLWETTLAPRATVAIRNSYRHGESAAVDATTWAQYVLKTGRLWAGGKIGRSRLEVVVPGRRHVLCPPHMSGSGGHAVRPAGAVTEVGPAGLALRWDLKDFAPTEDLGVCLVDLDRYAYPAFAELSSRDLGRLDAAALRRLRNEVYALHGYVFKSEDLRDYFSEQWWYRPDPGYTPRRLTREQRELVRRVKAEEDARSQPRRAGADVAAGRAPAGRGH